MNIHIVAKKIDVTPAFEKFVKEKVGTVGRFVKTFEKEGELDCFIEISRITRHHRKGEVFSAEIIIQLPKKIIQGKTQNEDARAAVLEAKELVKNEIVRYNIKRDKKNKR